MFVPSPESAKILKWLAQFGATSAAVLALKTCGPWEWEEVLEYATSKT